MTVVTGGFYIRGLANLKATAQMVPFARYTFLTTRPTGEVVFIKQKRGNVEKTTRGGV
jgi:hypothetical protein